MKWSATIATNQIDQDNEQFSDAALAQMTDQSPGVPISYGFAPPVIGTVQKATLESGAVFIEAASNTPNGLYAVPAITFDPNDCTVENGVKVYHRVRLTSIGLTHDPSDTHLSPVRSIE